MNEQRADKSGAGEERAGEDRFRLAADAVPQIVWITDAEGRAEFMNRQWEEYTGEAFGPTTAGEVAARFVHPDDAGPTMAAFEAARRAGGTFAVEHRIRSKAGEYRWFMVRGEPYRDPGTGEITRWYGASVDIHDRKVAEAALRESEGRLRAVLENTEVGIAQVDMGGRFVLVNGRFCEIVGRPREALLGGMRMQDVTHAEDLPGNLVLFRKLVGDGEPFQIEKRYVRPDGEVVWVSNSVSLVRGAGGEAVGVVAATVDVTGRRAAEAALRESEGRFREMADTAPAMLWVTEPNGYCSFLSRGWYEFTGQTEAEALGFGWANAAHPDDRAAAREAFVAANIAGRPYAVDFRLRRADGEYRWVIDAGRPRFGRNGEFRGFIGSVIDITDRKRAEDERNRLLESERAARAEAERASAAKSEFLSVLSHELRTPLTPVLLTASLMEAHPELPESLREDVAAIRRNVELEARLIGDLLDLTRIEKGKLHLDEADVDVHGVARAAVEICVREAAARVEFDLRARRHVVRGDRTRLHQIFWNLVSNAIKFTGPEGRVTMRSRDVEGGRVRVEVVDTGVGIDPAVLPRLFNAFEQGEVRAARMQAGLGLGLAISKKVAEAHGGTISAHSEGRGKGATFAVELPALAAAEEVTKRPVNGDRVAALAAANGGGGSGGLDVLLVEDHEPTLKVMSRLLRHIGHRVTGVGSAAAGVAAARERAFDVIVCDLGLPDGSGLDVMRQVRDGYEGRAIALTGYGMESDVAASKAAGFALHLTKPVDLEHLRAGIAAVAGGGRGSVAGR